MPYLIIENEVVVGYVRGPTTDPNAVEVQDDDPRIAEYLASQAQASKP